MIRVDGYAIDVAVRLESSGECEVTSWPVEVGANMTDHVRRKPAMVTLEGLVSDTPIGEMIAERATTTRPTSEAHERLQAILDAREPVTIVTERRTYTSMLLQKLTEPEDAGTGDGLSFTASFVEIILATNNRAFVRVEPPRGKKKNTRGNKPTTPVTNEKPVLRSSAKKLFNFAAGDENRVGL
jgi:hypothetical protein